MIIFLQVMITILVIVASKKIVAGWGWRIEDFFFGYELAVVTLFFMLSSMINFAQEWQQFPLGLKLIYAILRKIALLCFLIGLIIVQHFTMEDIKNLSEKRSKITVTIYSNVIGVIIFILFNLIKN